MASIFKAGNAFFNRIQLWKDRMFC